MNLDVVTFDGNSSNPIPRLGKLAVEAIAESRETLPHPVAHLVCNADLERIKEANRADQFENRGKQDKIELSRKLLRRKRIPFVATNYTVRGRLIRGVTDLLSRAIAALERNIYIIGVPMPLFTELCRYAGQHSPPVKLPVAYGETENWRFRLEQFRQQQQPIPAAARKDFVGVSDHLEYVRYMAIRAAANDDSVLILGESGTGKEIVARLIHNLSRREKEQFIPVNCAAIPETLFESQVFGHEEGAFTDAKNRMAGFWELAAEGTLFLDEIGDLAKSHQAKILRALQDRKIRPLGAKQEIEVKARIIAATNQDIPQLIRNRDFREDLYMRLRSFVIEIPPLREHPEDCAPLATHFWRVITKDNNAKVPEEVVVELKRYPWPGNVRELYSVLRFTHSLMGQDSLNMDMLKTALYPRGEPAQVSQERNATDLR